MLLFFWTVVILGYWSADYTADFLCMHTLTIWVSIPYTGLYSPWITSCNASRLCGLQSNFGEFNFTYHQKHLPIQFKIRHNECFLHELNFWKSSRYYRPLLSCEHIKKNLFKKLLKNQVREFKKVHKIIACTPSNLEGWKLKSICWGVRMVWGVVLLGGSFVGESA